MVAASRRKVLKSACASVGACYVNIQTQLLALASNSSCDSELGKLRLRPCTVHLTLIS